MQGRVAVATLGGLIEKWVKSVQVSDTERTLYADVPEHPFGTPAESIGQISNTEAFNTRVARAQLENALVKTPGSDAVVLLPGFEHLSEPIQMIINDQIENNPLFRHARMEVTFRQTMNNERPARILHVDPSRTESAVEEDYVYFLSNKQGTIAQAKHVKSPEQTLNKMTPEGLIEEGLLKQAGAYEMFRGRQSTYHTQGAAVYEPGRTFIRVIVTHPDMDYFRNLPDREKAALPQEFREQNGIVVPELITGLH